MKNSSWLKYGIGAFGLLLCVGCFLTSLAFMWQPWIYGVFGLHWVGWLVTAILCVIVIAVAKSDKSLEWSLAVIIACVAIWGGYIWYSSDTYGSALSRSFEPEKIALPEITQWRYIPMEIAKVNATSDKPGSTQQIGDMDPLFSGDQSLWIGPEIPNGVGNWLQNTSSAVVIEDDNQQIHPTSQAFACSEGATMSRDIYWKLAEKRYNAGYNEVYYVRTAEGKWLMVAPYLSYEFHFPVYIPTWGGVMVIVPETCSIEDLTPLQAQNDPRLKGKVILFPESLSRDRALSWGYRFGGLANKLFFHVEDIDSPKIEFSKNQMPYLIPTSWGNQWMLAGEPSGSTNKATSKIFWFDWQTGKARLTEFGPEETLIGPDIGTQYAKNKTANFVWAEGESSGTYIVIEPRPVPVTRGNSKVLYWMYSVTTRKFTGVSFTALLNMRNKEDVVYFCTKESLQAWVNGTGRSDDPRNCTAGTLGQPAPSQPSANTIPVSGTVNLTGKSAQELATLATKYYQAAQDCYIRKDFACYGQQMGLYQQTIDVLVSVAQTPAAPAKK